MNPVTALGFYSMFGSLESLLNLKQKQEIVTAISVEVFPGLLQTEQNYIGKWREAIEAEMNIRQSETLAPMCKTDTQCTCVEYEDDCGPSLLSADMCEIRENVGEILQVDG